MPQMLVVGNDIYAVWSDTISGKSDIFFAKSANSGATFETQVNLPTAKTGESGYAALAESESNIYVVWHNGRPAFANHRTASGWQVPVQLSGAETAGTAPVASPTLSRSLRSQPFSR